MEFKRCDRCGEEIKPQKGMPNMLNLISKTINEAFNKLAGKPDYIITDKHTLKPADLCPACQKSFEDWMRNGKPEKTEEIPEDIQTKKAYIIPEDAVKFGDF